MASPKIMRLSANMRWETVKAGQITFKPLKTPLLSASQRREHRTSMQIMSKYGEREHPWRRPLSRWKKPPTSPLILTLMREVQTQDLMRSTNYWGSPASFKAWRRKGHPPCCNLWTYLPSEQRSMFSWSSCSWNESAPRILRSYPISIFLKQRQLVRADAVGSVRSLLAGILVTTL